MTDLVLQNSLICMETVDWRQWWEGRRGVSFIRLDIKVITVSTQLCVLSHMENVLSTGMEIRFLSLSKSLK